MSLRGSVSLKAPFVFASRSLLGVEQRAVRVVVRVGRGRERERGRDTRPAVRLDEISRCGFVLRHLLSDRDLGLI